MWGLGHLIPFEPQNMLINSVVSVRKWEFLNLNILQQPHCIFPQFLRGMGQKVKSSLSTPFSQHSWHSVPSPCLFLHRSSLSLLSFFVVYTFVYLSESFPFPHECKLTVSKIVPGVIVGYQIFTEWTNKWKKEPNWMAPTSGSTLSVGCNLPPSPRPSFPFPSSALPFNLWPFLPLYCQQTTWFVSQTK